MKKLILFLITFLSSLYIIAQNFTITSFSVLESDISARVNMERDLNNRPCALIKMIADKEFEISGPLGIVKRINKPTETWIYVPNGTKLLTFSHPKWGVLRDYQLPMKLIESTTYEAHIELTKQLKDSINPAIKKLHLVVVDVKKDGKITSNVVYSMDEQQLMTPVFKYEYDYEGSNIISKKQMRWNEEIRDWENLSLLTINYSTKVCISSYWVAKVKIYIETQSYPLSDAIISTLIENQDRKKDVEETKSSNKKANKFYAKKETETVEMQEIKQPDRPVPIVIPPQEKTVKEDQSKLPFIKDFSVSIQDGNHLDLAISVYDKYHLPLDFGVKYISQYDKDTLMNYLTYKAGLDNYRVSLNDLHPNANYTFIAYCTNENGSHENKSLQVSTVNAVYLNKPGSLESIIAQKQKSSLKSLKIIGKINSSDIACIREMSGIENEGTGSVEKVGFLEKLDLSDATIVPGGEGVFYNGTKHYSQKNIWSYWFLAGTVSLKDVILPKTVKDIDKKSFCLTHLESIIVPQENSIFSSIDGVLFSKNLNRLISYPPYKINENYSVPFSVSKIDSFAISYIENTKTIQLPNSLKTISKHAFYGSNLDELTIPESVSSLEDQVCLSSKLKRIMIYASVSELGIGFCWNCGQLEYVVLGKKISTIKKDSFTDCAKLKEIHCLSIFPPIVEKEYKKQFSPINFKQCKIYVPKGSISAYKTAPIWGTFSNIIEE